MFYLKTVWEVQDRGASSHSAEQTEMRTDVGKKSCYLYTQQSSNIELALVVYL